MDDKRLLELILEEQSSIGKDITQIKVTLGKQEESLATHIYRTEIAEKNIENIKKELEPVKDHVKAVNTILKALGILSIVLSIVVAIFKIKTFILG